MFNLLKNLGIKQNLYDYSKLSYSKGFKGVPILILSFLILNGCADVSLVLKEKLPKPKVTVYSTDEFCIVDPFKINGKTTKILFLVDISHSNSNADPTGSKRIDNIDNFVQHLEQGGGSHKYGLIFFARDASTPISYEDDSSQARFTSNIDEFYSATKQIQETTFWGTKYTSVLQAAQSTIETDIEKFPSEDSSYIVLLISDGRPTDSTPMSEIPNLINSNNGNIYLSTAYYGNSGSQAIEILSEMAQRGGGKFANFEDGEYWDLGGLIVQSNVIPWSLKEFLVYNLNAGFCLDGKIDVDSDMDGMCDRDELEMNSIYAEKLSAEENLFDPTNRFSFGDGYGDFFHWLRFKYPGKTLPICTNRLDEDFDLLTVCEENEIQNQTEDELLTGDPKIFDTDKDGIIDGIETFVYFPSINTGGATRYTVALDSTNLEKNIDGEGSVLTQIKQHKNPWFNDPYVKTYDTTINPTESSSGDCYEFRQSSLPLYETLPVKEGNTLPGLEHAAGENSVMIYYIQVLQQQPNDYGVLKRSIQKIKWGQLSLGLKVDGETFLEYTSSTSLMDNGDNSNDN